MDPEKTPTKAESPTALSDGSVIEEAVTPLSERKRRMAVSESDVLPNLVSAMNMINESTMDDYRDDRTSNQPPLDYLLSRAKIPAIPVAPTRKKDKKSQAPKVDSREVTSQLKERFPSYSHSEPDKPDKPDADRARKVTTETEVAELTKDSGTKDDSVENIGDELENPDSDERIDRSKRSRGPRMVSRTRCNKGPI